MSDDTRPVETEPGKRQVNPRLVVALVGLALVIIFAAVNAQNVKVDFVVDSFEVPLVIVILGAVVLGGVIDRLLIVQRRRRARHS